MRWNLLVAAAVLVAGAPVSAAPPLLPMPRSVVEGAGWFRPGAAPGIAVPSADKGARNAAERFTELMRLSGTRQFRFDAAHGAIRFERAPGFAAEAYRLTVSPTGATVRASDDAGLFYGAVTLWQLATARADGALPLVTIDDAPRFRWRGLLLDSARHFQSPAFVRRLIDWMAVNKLNILHWHLVDDQGWRLEIRKYPRLTAIGGWRRPATAPGTPPLPVTGGYYTQAQVRAIVAYAAARAVTIVPEIEMPGHATSAIRAYPWLGVGPAPAPGVESSWGVFPSIYSPGERTFAFLRDVLDETMALFPSPWIHIGGDEPVFDRWKASADVQRQIGALKLKDEKALQGWFVARIGGYLASHGRRMIGWDEILDGAPPPDAAVMSWRGSEGAIAAARTGRDAVLSPSPMLYLDHVQGSGPAEPPGRGGAITLADVYAFDPAPAALPAEARGRILGVQANLWTEHVRTEARAAWMAFPRAIALAEIGWSPAGPRDYGDFLRRLTPQLDRMKPLGLAPATSAFGVTASVEMGPDGGARARLANPSMLPIRYTLDGAAPSGQSRLYAAPLPLAAQRRLRAAAFLDGHALPDALDAVIGAAAALARDSRALDSCANKVVLDLEDDYPAAGPRAHFLIDVLQPCWIWRAAPAGRGAAVALTVGQLPFNFEVGADRDRVAFRPPATPAGEFEVRDGCDGARVAVLPLAPAIANPGLTRLIAPLAARDGADLCITYTARGVDPLWAVASVEIVPR